jgi:ATP-dependent exoDNAse (exonuclease V) beta subunit
LNQASDLKIRQRALDIHGSFAVSAPAGSGKTELLTQRVLALLAVCEEPENILAITFTRKAAAEMQQRILDALNKAQQPKPATLQSHERTTWELAYRALQRNNEKQWQLIECPNRLRITTIDSLCRSLSQQMPYFNQFGPLVDVVEDPQFIYEAAARETLAMVSQKGEISNHLIKLIKHFDNNLPVIESLFVRLLSKRDQWLALLFKIEDQRAWLENILQETINEHLALLKTHLHPISSDLIMLADYAAGNIENSASLIKTCRGLTSLPQADFRDLPQWLGIVELLLTANNSWRNRLSIKEGFLAPSDKKLSADIRELAKNNKDKMESLINFCKEHSHLQELLANTRFLPTSTYSDQQWQLLESLTTTLKVLVGNLLLSFHKLSKTDYLQVALSALDALGDNDNPTDISLHLDYKIQHILIDEFQDTSTTQLTLLKKITAGWQAGDGRTLFAVGDAMQSCYRFRDANVGIFLDVRQHGLAEIALEALDLETNFRSQAAIVDWVNHAFVSIFPPANNSYLGAVSYLYSINFKPQSKEAGVQTFLFAYSEGPSAREHEAEQIADIIHETKSKRPEASIAVLVRKKDDIKTIIKSLDKDDIDYQAVEMDRLSNNMAILDLLSLTKALLYPNDRISWLALLRAPWCGLDMNDLTTVANYQENNQQPTLLLQAIADNKLQQSLSSTGAKKLQRLQKTISAALNQRFRLPLRRWIYSTWLSLGGNAILVDEDNETVIDNFFLLLDQYEKGGTIENLKEFETALSQLFVKPKTTREHAVELMTIHKSKGLEFDTVIIPALDKQQRRPEKELLLWLEQIHYNADAFESESQLMISPSSAIGNEKDSIYEHIEKQNLKKDALESDRLLYVGCTRAINQLYLLGNVNIDEKSLAATEELNFSHLKQPSSSSFLASLWKTLEEDSHTIIKDCRDPLIQDNSLTPLSHPNKIASLNEDWQAPALPHNYLLQRYRGNNQLAENSENIASPDSLNNRNSRYLGSVIHLVLQKMVSTGLSSWTKSHIEEEKNYWAVQLLQLGLHQEKLSWALNRIEQCVTKILSDETAQWLLDNSHEDSQTELSLWDKNRQHIIDRTFVENQEDTQTRWIVDYKSSTPNPEQSIEEFLLAETDLYQQQLYRYAKLFAHENIPVKLALYFPLTGVFHQIPHYID